MALLFKHLENNCENVLKYKVWNFQLRLLTSSIVGKECAEKEWQDSKPVETIPGPKPLPIPYGNVWRFAPFAKQAYIFYVTGTFGNKGWLEIHKMLMRDYGPIVQLAGLGPKPLIALYDPDYIEAMFRNETAWPLRDTLRSFVYYREKIRRDVFRGCGGLVTAQGKEWQEFRSAVNQTMMQPRNTKMYTKPINTVTDHFINRIKSLRDEKLEMPKDFSNELNKWSLESIAVIALDTRLGCLEGNLSSDSEAQRMISAVHDMLDCTFYLDIMPSLWRYISTPKWRKFVKATDIIVETTQKHVLDKVKSLNEKMGKEGYQPRSVLESLLFKSENSQTPIIMAMDMLMAGVDTTSNAAATCVYHISKNPDKQEMLFDEIKKFLPTKDTSVTMDILNELKFLKASIKESMRISPIAPANQRTAAKDFIIGDYQIPKGTQMISMHLVLTNSEKYFKQADRFLPERWLKSEVASDISAKHVNPFIFLPFGFGPRMCIGRRFAELELEILLAKVIRNFKIQYNYGEMTFIPKLLYTPDKPLRFKMEDRID